MAMVDADNSSRYRRTVQVGWLVMRVGGHPALSPRQIRQLNGVNSRNGFVVMIAP